MDGLIDYLFGAASVAPSAYHLSARPGLVALHAVSDVGIAASYFAIPLAIIVFARRRDDITGEARAIAILFSAFIVLCGVTHLFGLVTLWYPFYGLDGVVKALTAVVSVLTAIVVWRMMPRLVAMPSPRQMETVNQQLLKEAAARDQAYRDLQDTRRDLEYQVAEQTRELADIRRLFEAATRGAQITVFSQDADLRYTWIHNPWMGLSAGDIVGRTDADFLPEPALSTSLEHKRRVLLTGRPETFEMEIPSGEESHWFRIDVTPVDASETTPNGIVCTAIDITRDKRLEAMRADLSARLSETVQRFNLALSSGDIVVFSQDTDLRYTWINTPDTQVGSVMGKTDAELFQERDRLAVVSLKKEAMAAREPRFGEVRIDSGGEVRWYDLFVEPNITAGGEVTGVTCASVDITEVKQNEEQMRLVMRELTHRSKNLLAVVQAIARQTAQQADTVPAFVDGFGERLRALSGAQDLLVAENWSGAQLEDVIRGQIGHYMPTDRSRVVIEGPFVTLTPEATQVLALAIHELATNAAKYGALSNDTGIVSVVWSIDRSDEVAKLNLIWREEAGPPVKPPERRGFGRIVVERNVAHSLDAKVDLQFPPEGAHVSFSIPLDYVIRTES